MGGRRRGCCKKGLGRGGRREGTDGIAKSKETTERSNNKIEAMASFLSVLLFV